MARCECLRAVLAFAIAFAYSSSIGLSLLPPSALAAPPPRPADGTCSIRDEATGREWDLYGLSRPTGSDYEVKDSVSGDVFKLNVCRSVLTEVWGVDDASKVGVYRARDKQKGDSLGSWNKTLTIQGDEVSMLYGDGSTCGNTAQRMTSIIAFKCATDVYGTGSPQFAGALPSGCAYFFTWSTPLACAHSQRRGFVSGALHFVFTILVVIMGYLGLSMLYNRFVKGARGVEQLGAGPLGWNQVKDVAVIAAIWVLDRLGELWTHLGSAFTRGGGNGGWAQTGGGRPWWEGGRGGSVVSPSGRASSNGPPKVVVTDDTGASFGSGKSAFVLGEEDERREEARAARVVRFERPSSPGSASAASTEAPVTPYAPAPTSERASPIHRQEVQSLVDA